MILAYRHVSCWRQSMSHCHPCIYRDQIASRLYCYIESATGWVDISKNCAANSVSLQKNAQLINQGGTPMHVCGGFSKYVPKKTSTTICLETQP